MSTPARTLVAPERGCVSPKPSDEDGPFDRAGAEQSLDDAELERGLDPLEHNELSALPGITHRVNPDAWLSRPGADGHLQPVLAGQDDRAKAVPRVGHVLAVAPPGGAGRADQVSSGASMAHHPRLMPDGTTDRLDSVPAQCSECRTGTATRAAGNPEGRPWEFSERNRSARRTLRLQHGP